MLIPPGMPALAEYYERKEHWPAGSLARLQALLPQIQAWQASQGDGRT